MLGWLAQLLKGPAPEAPAAAPTPTEISAEERLVPLSDLTWQTIEQLRERGDRPEVIRQVDHYLYPDPDREADREALMTLVAGEPGWAAAPALEGGVHATVEASTTAASVDGQIALMEEFAARTGFVWDGWGSHVMAEE